MKYCTKCNAQFDDNAMFCDTCGIPLREKSSVISLSKYLPAHSSGAASEKNCLGIAGFIVSLVSIVFSALANTYSCITALLPDSLAALASPFAALLSGLVLFLAVPGGCLSFAGLIEGSIRKRHIGLAIAGIILAAAAICVPLIMQSFSFGRFQ